MSILGGKPMHRDFELFSEENDWLEGNIEPRPAFTLNNDQQLALDFILKWLQTDEPFCILSGSAGTGKTFTIKALIPEFRGKVVFTAPTNKATKVLRAMLTTEDYKPICRTIYSLLGLKLEPNGEVKQLSAPEGPVDLSSIDLIIIDEGSMINAALTTEINRAVENYGLKILIMGDQYQLPPVNEATSQIWKEIDQVVTLEKVMRFDNQILGLANKIRNQVNHPAPSIQLVNNNDMTEGVWSPVPQQFRQMIIRAAVENDFSNPLVLTKAIAWRNTTVAEMNQLIRSQIFDNSSEVAWLVGDRIILTAPASDLENKPIGCTDDEGTVELVEITQHPLFPTFKIWSLSVITDENKRINLLVLHKESEFEFRFHQTNLANEARLWPKKWKDYWAFNDAFHKVQYGYAITAHRAQGSTYENCFVAWNDILMNRNRAEAFRCLYVSVTRPRKKLILGGW